MEKYIHTLRDALESQVPWIKEAMEANGKRMSSRDSAIKRRATRPIKSQVSVANTDGLDAETKKILLAMSNK